MVLSREYSLSRPFLTNVAEDFHVGLGRKSWQDEYTGLACSHAYALHKHTLDIKTGVSKCG